MIRTFHFLLLLAVTVLFKGCAERPQQLVLQGNALGTTYGIAVFEGELNVNPEQLRMSIDSVLEAVNASMSTYRSNSLISRLNAEDSTVVIDAMFEEVFLLSKRIHQESGGYFDPTVGILVNAWGFGPEGPRNEVPQLENLLPRVGLDKVRISEGSMIKEVPGVQLDFNAIAKGYTLVRIAVLIRNNGGLNYLIELGGEIVASGMNLTKQALWTIGIDNPQDTQSLSRVIPLRDAAMATSGNYRKFRVDSISGRPYGHTINPLNGRAETTNVLSASVIAPTCAEADAYATAFMAMPLHQSLQFLAGRPEFSIYLIYVDQDNTTSVLQQGLFAETIGE
jgi:thiamine biosynthesis lipoprotein